MVNVARGVFYCERMRSCVSSFQVEPASVAFFFFFFEDVGMKNCLAKSDQKSVSGSNKPAQPCVLAAVQPNRVVFFTPRPSHAHGLLSSSSPRKVKHFFIYFAA